MTPSTPLGCSVSPKMMMSSPLRLGIISHGWRADDDANENVLTGDRCCCTKCVSKDRRANASDCVTLYIMSKLQVGLSTPWAHLVTARPRSHLPYASQDPWLGVTLRDMVNELLKQARNKQESGLDSAVQTQLRKIASSIKLVREVWL